LSYAPVSFAQTILRRAAIKKTEAKNPQLEADIVTLAEPESQTDPKFHTTFNYTRITAKGMRKALVADKGWKTEDLPCEKNHRQNPESPELPPAPCPAPGAKGQAAEKDQGTRRHFRQPRQSQPSVG
jgi:hypothetical protein